MQSRGCQVTFHGTELVSEQEKKNEKKNKTKQKKDKSSQMKQEWQSVFYCV